MTIDVPAELCPELNFDVLPPDVRQLKDDARRFAQETVKPLVGQLDQAPAEDFDWDVVRRGHEIGLTRAAVPTDYGGLGLGMLGVATALEEVAAVCPGTALVFGATMLGQAPLLLSGDPRLQARYLPLFSGDEPVLACNAVTEEDAGCDLIIPANAQHARNVMTARRDGDEYVLTGRKRFITNARFAAFASVFANTEGSPEPPGSPPSSCPWTSPGSYAARSPTRWATAHAWVASWSSTRSGCPPRT